MTKITPEQLINAANHCLDANYDGKYHHVAAAVVCRSKIYTGINIDVIHGSCGEFTAMGAALTDGQRKFDMIVAVGRHNGKNVILSPCGNCRQMLLYIAPKIKVIVPKGKGFEAKTLKDLLPCAYTDHR